jgi:hypothetical protein
VEKAGDGQHVLLRDMGHISPAATTGPHADEGDENIIVGELDLGKKFLFCIDESRDVHDSTAFPSQLYLKRLLKNTRFVISTEGRNLITVDKS